MILQNPKIRMLLMALAMLSLLAALNAGLIRMGWGMPSFMMGMGVLHGPLMVCGFLGTMIGLERAVALGRRWAYAAPVCSAFGAVLLQSGAALMMGAFLFTLGSLVMVAIFYVIVRRQPATFTKIMALGAGAWCVGNLLWLAGVSLAQVTIWWSAFLILTIVGERLELSRILRVSRASELFFMGALGVFVGGVLLSTVESLLNAGLFLGERLAGLGMIGLAVWLLRHDIARRTVRQTGLTRYIAVCLLLGYVWLLVGGALWLVYAGATAGPYYDALLHVVFVGFVMSMIFGHMPIILPAVLGRAVLYSALMFSPLLWLHLSLGLRIAGDLFLGLSVRQWGGMLNGVAILAFMALTVRAIALSTITSRRNSVARSIDYSPLSTAHRNADHSPIGHSVSRRIE